MTAEINPTNYAMLSFDALRLGFPQDQVLNIELLGAVQQTNTVEHPAVGSLIHNGIEVPVYSMSEDLCLTTLLSEDCRICVSFHTDGEPSFALACDTVEPLQSEETMLIQPLPEPMLTDMTPVRMLLRDGNKLVYLSHAMAMSAYMGITNFNDGGEQSAQN